MQETNWEEKQLILTEIVELHAKMEEMLFGLNVLTNDDEVHCSRTLVEMQSTTSGPLYLRKL